MQEQVVEENEKLENHQIDKNSYNSPIAQTIEASGNFINNISNPWFVMVIILLLGGGFMFYKTAEVVTNSVDKLSNKLDNLSRALMQQREEHIREVDALNRVLNLNLKPKVIAKDNEDE